ncbi:MAG: GrpB family protein [Actinoplanes sp.]
MAEYPPEVRQRFHGTPEQLNAGLVGEPPKRWQSIVIEEYDPAWADRFAAARSEITEALGDLVIGVEHVGSTSVPGLPAKSIIDIDLLIDDTEDESGYLPALARFGYRLVLREPWWHGHRMLVGPAEDIHLHVWPRAAPEPVRHRLFRDWLRAHPADRELYAAAKRRLAPDADRYSLAKNEVIDQIFDRIFALGEITFRVPGGGADFLDGLRTIFGDVAYASAEPGGGVVLTPPRPAGARPVTAFRPAEVAAPEVALDTGVTIGLRGGGRQPRAEDLDMADLAQRLAGHVDRVDHTGVNLPIAPDEWQQLVRSVAATATMYRYPDGEEWPFVLPSAAEELAGDIRDFVVGREPRFELVQELWNTHTTWQIALWTSLTRPELERLFPAPYGTTLPGLEDFFRTVYVRSPWPDLAIRFDLCYRVEDGPTDWETGEWLVTAGGRIRPE